MTSTHPRRRPVRTIHVHDIADPSRDEIVEETHSASESTGTLYDLADLRMVAAAQLIIETYDDPSRAAVQDTPRRMAQMFREMLTPQDFTFTTFDAEGADQMVVVSDIPFYSLCEHHLLPFFGTATIAYIPSGRIAGLSKLPRTVDYFAHRLQTQERMTNQIAAFIGEKLDPIGVGVVLHARHMCMEMRGVRKPGSMTMSSALIGALRDKPEARAEFLALAGVRRVG